MPVSTRIIRRRIKSVTNTRKITKAMELVAASKMRRAIASVLATRPYAEAAWRAVREIAKVSDPGLHPLLAKKKEKMSGRILLVVFTSDRGLCGGFNAQMLREIAAFLRTTKEEMDIVAVGKKGQASLLRMQKKIIAAFADLTNNPRIVDVR